MNTPLTDAYQGTDETHRINGLTIYQHAAKMEADVAELNQRLIDRRESFQTQVIRIEETWRERMGRALVSHFAFTSSLRTLIKDKDAQVLAFRKTLQYIRDVMVLEPAPKLGQTNWPQLVKDANSTLSTPPPPCVPLEDVLPLVKALSHCFAYSDNHIVLEDFFAKHPAAADPTA